MGTRTNGGLIIVAIAATVGVGAIDHFSDDADKDGIEDEFDNCPHEPNKPQLDRDRDRVGDVCDICPDVPAPGFSDGCPAR